MRLFPFLPLLAGLAGASQEALPMFNLQDMPRAFLWHTRSIVQHIAGKSTPDYPVPPQWSPDRRGANTPPGSLVVLVKGDFIGDEQPEYAISLMLDDRNEERTQFICSENLDYRYHVPNYCLYYGQKEGAFWRGETVMSLFRKPDKVGKRWLQWELGADSARCGEWSVNVENGEPGLSEQKYMLFTGNGAQEACNGFTRSNLEQGMGEVIAARETALRLRPGARSMRTDKHVNVYATTLHELLTVPSPRWVQISSFVSNFPHFRYRDAAGLNADDTRECLTPFEALEKLNQHLGVEPARNREDIPCPLFPTKRVHVNTLPFNPKKVVHKVTVPEGMPPLPSLKTAPQALLQHLYMAAPKFEFESDAGGFERGTYPGGELQVELLDVFGDSAPELLVRYVEPLVWALDRGPESVTFVLDSRGRYRYAIRKGGHLMAFSGWPEYKTGSITRGEFALNKNYGREPVSFWGQHEKNESYARLVAWVDAKADSGSGEEAQPPQQMEVICTPEGEYPSTTSCHVGRPAYWRFLDFRQVVDYISSPDMRHPAMPYWETPVLRTSLYEFLTREKPRWVPGDLPEDMIPAPQSYTTQEARRVLRERLFPGGLPEATDAPLLPRA